MTLALRRPTPRDYLTVPARFGRHPAVDWVAPLPGSEVTLALAQAQHAVALAIHTRRDATAARRISTRFGFSVQSWSDYTLGKAWMTPAAWAAAATLLLEAETPAGEIPAGRLPR